jgi:hypothetical protein
MTTTPKRAVYSAMEPVEPLELSSDDMIANDSFDQHAWTEQVTENRATGGRTVLAWVLALLAAAWLAYSAWSAGRFLAGAPLSSPVVAQWVAVAAGPLALLGLIWLMFGRTRRKEAERFTRSVVHMRTEAQSLEALLEVLSQRIDESQRELVGISRSLMDLGDQTTEKLGGITRSLDESTGQLRVHGEALDRAAQAARVDIGVLLEDLPRAESIASGLAEQMRTIGAEAATRTDQYGQQVARLIEQSRMADEMVSAATASLSTRLAEIETAGTTAKARIDESEAGLSGALDLLLERTSVTLAEIRNGIDVQAEAVRALVDQASAGIGKAGADSSETLAANVSKANSALLTMSEQIAERETASRQMLAEIERGLALIDQRFNELASSGDDRANHFLDSLTRARGELDLLASSASEQDVALGTLAERTEALQSSIGRLVDSVRGELGQVLGESEQSAGRLVQSTETLRPEMGWIRDAAVEASDRLGAASADIASQEDRLAALLAQVDDGVAGAQSRLSELASLIVSVGREAEGLSSHTGPALVSALVQVKETAAHAAERAREAIEAVIPASAGKLSAEVADALEKVIRESVEERLRGVEGVAAKAVESARAASERLTGQMLAIGQTASALEAHMEQTREDQREKDSEAFARRVALLIDSMHSAAIDVGKILSDEIDDKAWSDYMKGDRAVFTRRAVRLIGASEARPIRAHYDSDMEFRRSADRYVHDFEAMLRRVVAEREGGMMAVALMSSDMGKLYAALAQAIDKRR